MSGFETWSPERREKFLARKQSFLRYLLDDEDLRQHPQIVDLALTDGLLGAATRYLGMVPSPSRASISCNHCRAARATTSRVNCFTWTTKASRRSKPSSILFDVGNREGPFTFIPADADRRIVNDIRRLRKKQGGHGTTSESRRYSDEEIAAVGGTGDIVTVTGTVGNGSRRGHLALPPPGEPRGRWRVPALSLPPVLARRTS